MTEFEKLPLLFNKAFELLFTKYPTRTGLGIIVGGAADFVAQLFDRALSELQYGKEAPWWGWIMVGEVVMHVPTIISAYRDRSVGDERIDKLLELIERGNFSATEKRQKYRDLIETVYKEQVNQRSRRTGRAPPLKDDVPLSGA